MSKNTIATIAIDLGDRKSSICALDVNREVVEVAQISTTRAGITRYFKRLEPTRVILEVGTHSPWVDRLLRSLGHETIVANARRVKLISANWQKSDQVDAELLARLGLADDKLLAPITHRKEDTQADLTVVRARDALVRSRTSLVNAARNLVKSYGERLPSCASCNFHKQAREAVPEALRDALEPMFRAIEALNTEIKEYDDKIEALCKSKYPETNSLQDISGVGPITALCFVLTLEAPDRFKNGRQVGAYVGLTPKKRQSGDSNPQLGITKCGDGYLRKLLVQCAQCILSPRGKDSALRRWGEQKVASGGKGAKKRAVTGVARKLSVVMYHLWKTGDRYKPFPEIKTRSKDQSRAGSKPRPRQSARHATDRKVAA